MVWEVHQSHNEP